MNKSITKQGFTIVELIVVISVIAILAGLSVVGYGSWRKNAQSTQVKSDLNAAASAMENARTFNNGYPTSLPTSISPTTGSVLTIDPSSTASSYCIDGSASADTSIAFYIASETSKQGPIQGSCATRPANIVPAVPTGLTIGLVGGTQINVSWSTASGTTSYTVQCASDAAFVLDLQSTMVSAPTTSATVTGLTPSSSFYCRVQARNSIGVSRWSSTVSTNTNNSYGTLAVATSIEGYWTIAPQGFLLEDGSEVSRATYASLFAEIGTTYGIGNGSTTFNLPDSRGKTTVNRNISDPEFATLGQISGSKVETLSIAQMPSHTHTQDSHTHSAGGRTEASGGGTASGFGGTISSLRSGTSNYTLDNQYVYVASTISTNQNTGGGGSHNNIQPSIVKTSAIKYSTPNPTAESPPVATSIQGYWSSVPSNYLLEDGSAISRTTYAELFAAIGTTYGAGNGSTTFNLPDSRGRASAGLSSTDSEFDSMGEKPGSKRETLSIAQMPIHTHVQNAHTHGASARNEAGSAGQASGWAGVASGIRSNTNNYTQENQTILFSTNTAINQDTGGGTSHNEIQPSIVKLSAIKVSNTSGVSESITPGTSLSGYWTSQPSGYLIENGSAVSRTTYSALFAAIGTTYGAGNGSTTFNLPDSRGRLSVNRNISDLEFDAMGEKYGTKVETISTAQMPSHTHIQDVHSHTATGRTEATGGGVAGGFGGAQSAVRANVNNYTLDSSYVAVGSVAPLNQNTGGGGSHNNIQPTIIKLFVIKY